MSDGFPTPEQVARMLRQFPAGARVELVSMSDPYTQLKPGDRGSVGFVDDTGTVFVDWDNGSKLGCVYGEDAIEKVQGEVSAKVWEQILSIRKMEGCPNIFDTVAVQRLAYQCDFYELVCFIEDDPGAYARFILTGKREK